MYPCGPFTSEAFSPFPFSSSFLFLFPFQSPAWLQLPVAGDSSRLTLPFALAARKQKSENIF